MLHNKLINNPSKGLKTIVTIGELSLKVAVKTPQKQLGQWVSKKVQELGPTYIKFGQFVSSRKDIFGSEFVNELISLRDNVAPMSYNEVYEVLKQYLDLSKFKNIEKIPLASASIGQVHKATLINGKNVVIKIKRPGVGDMIKNDVSFLKSILSLMQMANFMNVKESLDILRDFESNILKEVDFKLEIEHLQRYKKIYSNNAKVTIPTVYNNLSSNDVIVMDFVPSKSIFLYKGDKVEMSYRLMDIFIKQLISYGLVHGDPHAGNIGYDENTDSIVLYDFGNVIEVSELERQRLKELIYQLVIRNKTGVMQTLTKLDMKIVDEELMSEYIDKYIDYLRTIDIKQLQSSSNGPQIKIPIVFSDKIFRLVRTYGIMEGICKDLNNKFDYFNLLTSYSGEIFLDEGFLFYKVSSDIDSIVGALGDTTKVPIQSETIINNSNNQQQSINYPFNNTLVYINILFVLYYILTNN